VGLVKCRECKKEISSKARVCPRCGVKDPGKSLGMQVLVVVVFVSIGLVSQCSEKATIDPASRSMKS